MSADSNPIAPVAAPTTKEKPPPLKPFKKWKNHYHKIPDQNVDDCYLYPDVFAYRIMEIDLYPKQRVALRKMAATGACVSFLANNDGGKTSIVVTALVCWHLFRFRTGKIVATSGSTRQLLDQMIPAIQKYREKFPSYKWLDSGPISRKEGGSFRFFTTNEPGRAEGDHADIGTGTKENPQSPLLMIVDEAKSVPEWLRAPIEDRVHPTRILLCSSPGFAEGWFYDTQTKPDYFPHYHVVRQCSAECPHVDPQWIAAIRKKWAGQPDMAASILGEGFMGMVADAIIDFRLLQENITNPPEYDTNRFDVHAFCDFSWSGQDGDECVLALRRSNRITFEAIFTADGLHAVCDRFIAEFKRIGLKASMITGDDGGGGHLVIDELHKRGWHIHRLNNEAQAKDSEHFASAIAEIWYNAATAIANRVFILPDDSEFKAQAINRKRIHNNKGKLAIESKRDMKERNVPSPDRPDAVFGCLFKAGQYSSQGETTFIQAIGPSCESIGV